MSYQLQAVKNVNYIVNYYSILEISDSSSQEEIKKAYKKLSKEYHPDKVQTAGDEIKKVAEHKMNMVSEAYSVLYNKKSRQEYDDLLLQFRNNNPKVISEDGRPILDLSQESLHLDFLISNEDQFDFQETQKTKVAQLVGHNELVFKTMEKAYLANPTDLELKEAYLDLLTKKKIDLDWQENFAWQALGVVNKKDSKIQRAEDYLIINQSYLDQIKDRYKNLSTNRLLPGSAPVQIGLNTLPAKVENLPELLRVVEDTLNKRSEKLLEVVKEKQEFLKKMVAVRTYEKVKSSSNNKLVVILSSKGSAMATFTISDTENPVVEMDRHSDNPETKTLSYDDANVYVLEFNGELDVSLQVMEFLQSIVNKEL